MQKITFWLIGFCASALSASIWPALPSLFVCLIFNAIISASLLTFKQPIYACVPSQKLKRFLFDNRKLFILLVILHGTTFGISWMASVGHWYTSWQQEVSKFKHEIMLTGEVLSISKTEKRGHLTLKVHSFNSKRTIISPNVLLYWYDAAMHIRRHQIINLTVRLKPSYGLANPGNGFRQQWLLSQGIIATGTIVGDRKINLLAPAVSLHSHIVTYLNSLGLVNQRWFKALLLGNRDSLTADDWALLQTTGVAHLFSISGLHMGILFLWCYSIFAVTVALYQRCAQIRSPHININNCVVWPVIIVLGCYAVIASAALPVVRAWLLISVYLLLQHARAFWGVWQKALVMTASCIFIFPLSLFSASFYLSVGAVGLIWFLLWHFRPVQTTLLDRLKHLTLMQCCLCLLMLPFTALWFGHVSWTAPLANLILVPIVSILLPVFLLALTIDFGFLTGNGVLLHIADHIMNWLIELMKVVAKLSLATDFPTADLFATVCLLLVVILLLFPRFQHKRKISCICCLPLITSLVFPSKALWRLHVFDVGQGTALAISKGNRAILVDTGAASEGRFSMMQQVIIPALRALNLNQIDMLFLSHDDNDHAGGKAAFITHFAKKDIYQPLIFTTDSGCHAGGKWNWQGLEIEAIWPQSSLHSGNNFSCVLKVSDRNHTVLLPGDIERATEYQLLYQNQSLKADIVVAPHHGSATSSTNIFVQTVEPEYVVYTTGYLNRWDFPADQVQIRYQNISAVELDTSKDGYIQFSLGKKDIIVRRLRKELVNRWYLHQPTTVEAISFPLMY